MIHICYKFQEIPFSSFLIMAQDRQNQSVIGQELKDYQGRLSHPDSTLHASLCYSDTYLL